MDFLDSLPYDLPLNDYFNEQFWESGPYSSEDKIDLSYDKHFRLLEIENDSISDLIMQAHHY